MTVSKIIQMKGREKIAMLTAYDAIMARVLEAMQMDIILVGDSLGTTVLGYPNTIPVTMEDVIRHSIAVRNGAPNSFIVTDMPFLSYGASIEQGVLSAGRILKESGVNAVKLEGGRAMAETVRAICEIGIPVMGHIGLKPQSVNLSGYKTVGKTAESIQDLIDDALSLENAGAFAIVLECVTDEAAKAVTENLSIPTIGIGAGKDTDGQVLVLTDMLGMDASVNLKHNKKYASLAEIISSAVTTYRDEVKKGIFP